MPKPVPASPERLTKRLEYLEAMLPRKGQDDAGGQLRTAGYLALLIGHSDAALAYMVREACATLDWFPTAKQCLQILAGYREPVSEQEVALVGCVRFASDAMERWLANMRDGQPIGDVPEQWIRVAIEDGSLRRLPGGRVVHRELYHGPFATA